LESQTYRETLYVFLQLRLILCSSFTILILSCNAHVYYNKKDAF